MVCEEKVVEISRLSSRGRGVGAKVEVAGGVPGDTLLVQLRGRRHGSCLQVLHSSSDRVLPRCPHVPLCGGCALQQMDYTAQLRWKQAELEKVFHPLLSSPSVLQPIEPCRSPWEYRNKMEFSFSQNKAGERFLGLILAGSKGRVLNLQECHLVSPWFMRVLKAVRLWWEESGLAAYRLDGSGHLRTLTVREGFYTKDKMVMLTVSGNPAFSIPKQTLAGFVSAVEGERISVFVRVQQAAKGMQTQFFEMHLSGPDHLCEKMRIGEREFTFKISPTAFFQPNTAQAEILFSTALSLISGPKQEVLDLYAGTATLGILFSSMAKRVTAIELNPYACFNAEENRELNGVDNLTIHCGDVAEKLAQLAPEGRFDLILLDPPRSGLDPKALAQVIALRVKEILYISCHPATQARDLEGLIAAGYRVLKVQPVDQFPHTAHVETVVHLALFSCFP